MNSRRLFLAVLVGLFASSQVFADGKVMPPRNYTGSLEEKAQEAIIIFHHGDNNTAREDLILKIQVEGDAEEFAWIIPFPTKPKIAKEDPRLFTELFNYVEFRRRIRKKSDSKSPKKSKAPASGGKVTVLSKETVGDYDITTVQETAEGGLNPWLKKEGFQELENADDVLSFYRKKKYVYACIKVNRKAIAKRAKKKQSQAEPKSPFPGGARRSKSRSSTMDSHPLRFTFSTGGTDAAYFPMKLTGLQKDPFDVNLYVFYRFWLNDNLSRFGYEHRGFSLKYRDWDTRQCIANGGKSYSLPGNDPFLKNAPRMAMVTKLFQKLHPGEKYYLTNIMARRMQPSDVRQWTDDLWLFPYYTDQSVIPTDAHRDGAAAAGFPDVQFQATSHDASRTASSGHNRSDPLTYALVVPLAVAFGLLCGVFGYWFVQRRSPQTGKGELDT